MIARLGAVLLLTWAAGIGNAPQAAAMVTPASTSRAFGPPPKASGVAGATGRPVMLVSDIDDTIRRTHVLSKSGLILNGLRTNNPFAAMNTLYSAWACDEHQNGTEFERCANRQGLTRSPQRLITYLTAAPGRVQMLSTLFLQNSLFPVGLFIGRNEVPDAGESALAAELARAGGTSDFRYEMMPGTLEFKVEALKRLITDFRDHDFILVGDNGQKDVAAFSTVTRWAARAHPRTRVVSYIHQVYDWDEGVRPEPGQDLYVTATDLGLEFFRHGWLSERSLARVLDETIRALGKDERTVFPDFLDCRPMTRSGGFPGMPGGLSPVLANKAAEILELIRRRCSEGPRLRVAPDAPFAAR